LLAIRNKRFKRGTVFITKFKKEVDIMEKTENPYERKKRIDEEIEKLIIKLCHHIDSEIDNMNDLISGEVAEMTKALAMLVSVSKNNDFTINCSNLSKPNLRGIVAEAIKDICDSEMSEEMSENENPEYY
jgi:hypothetical protein